MKTELIQLRTTKEFKKAVEKAAEAENRSVTNFFENLFFKHLNEQS